MKKRKTTKSVRSLPTKALSAKNAKGVKGGGETVHLTYGQIEWKYTQQTGDGSVEKK
jgi:hypothetical protein